MTGGSGFQGQRSDELGADAADLDPGPTRSFPGGTGPGTDASTASPPEVPPTVGLLKGTSDAGWVRGTVDDDRADGDKPLSTQTRPQFPGVSKPPVGRKTRPGRKKRRHKGQGRRQAFMMGAGIALGLLVAVVVVLVLDRTSGGDPPGPAVELPTAVGEDVTVAVVDPAAAKAARAEEADRVAREARRKKAARQEAAREEAARAEAARKEAARKEALDRAAAGATPAPKAETDAERLRRENEEKRRARKASEGAAAHGGKPKGEGGPSVASAPPKVKDGRTGTAAPNPMVLRLSAEHVPVTRATMGTSKTVTVTVDGPADTTVTMNSGPLGGPYKTSTLRGQGSGVWKGTLTIDAEVAAGLEYWIIVKNSSTTPRVVTLGRQSAPNRVAVY